MTPQLVVQDDSSSPDVHTTLQDEAVVGLAVQPLFGLSSGYETELGQHTIH